MSAFKSSQPDPKTTATSTLRKFFAPTIQPKLTINKPGGAHEQEADRVADQVVQRLSTSPSEKASAPLSSSTIQTKCANCEQEEKLQQKEEEDQTIQEKIQRKPVFDSNTNEEGNDKNTTPIKRKESASGGTAAGPDFSNRLSASKGGGSPLPKETNTAMGNAIGADFSNVRIHTGGAAAQMSEDIQAQAFTHGNDVYFNEGKYDTSSDSGKRLLAHELTHTAQQGGVQQKIQKQDTATRSQRSFQTNYLSQLSASESLPYQVQIEAAIAELEQHSGDRNYLTEDGDNAVSVLRRYFTEGRIQIWRTGETLAAAAFSRRTRPSTIRIHVICRNDGSGCGNPSIGSSILLHEGIHALHSEQYPGIDALYRIESPSLDFYKWRIWTEYRTRVEMMRYQRHSSHPITEEDHREIMHHPEMRELYADLHRISPRLLFDPRAWSPPRRYARRQRRRD